jgi:hypothetical protein
MDADDDLAACRAGVIQFLDHVQILLDTNRRKYLALTDLDRKRLSIEAAVYAFNRLDKHLVAPIAKTHRAEAAEIYRTIHCFALSLFQAGVAVLDTGRIEYESLEKHLKSMQSTKGGKNKNPQWAAAALPRVKKWVSANANYKTKQLIGAIVDMEIPGTPGEREIRNRITEWVKNGYF